MAYIFSVPQDKKSEAPLLSFFSSIGSKILPTVSTAVQNASKLVYKEAIEPVNKGFTAPEEKIRKISKLTKFCFRGMYLV